MTRTVLIIDDEIDSCLLLKSFLSQMEFQVYTAFTLSEGMQLLDSITPAIIFLDNNLPDGLGWEKIDYIHEKVPSCKINLVSAYDIDKYKLNDRDVKIIEKPFSLSLIKNALD